MKKFSIKFLVVIIAGLLIFSCNNHAKQTKELSTTNWNKPDFPFWDYTLPIDVRVEDLLSRLNIDEKIEYLMLDHPAIERLAIPRDIWGHECLHGIARSGKATVFPQAIGLAATFDEELIENIASAIGDEARAKRLAAIELGQETFGTGLTFFTPNINIFRDPRWGRGQETYGEDPFLTGKIGAAFVKGLQGNHPKYLKAAACAKHYAAHSGPEYSRHDNNPHPSKKDLYETYLPAFKSLIDVDVQMVMSTYNKIYDTACFASSYLQQDILRKQLGFNNLIISDGGAIKNLHTYHKTTNNATESATMALNRGCDLNLGQTYKHLKEAYEKGMVTEERINEAVRLVLEIDFKIGTFDPPELNPYNNVSYDVINSKEHQELARTAAAKSIVLLKNKNNVLPLKTDIKKLYILGNQAAGIDPLLGNYYGLSGNMVTILEGIVDAVHPGTKAEYRPGALLTHDKMTDADWTDVSHRFDAIIAVMGIDGRIEGEEGASIASPSEGDRTNPGLPENQIEYLKKQRSYGDKPIILVLTSGSPVIEPEMYELADAILYAWYPGEQGGNAVADIIFGKTNPSGRLPVTIPKSIDDLPDFDDYSMENRTYKYATKAPEYPFGFGLSYTSFEYSNISTGKNSISDSEEITVKFQLKNTGEFDGEEVVQLYINDNEASVNVPINSLCSFKRVFLKKGETKELSFTITPEMLKIVNNEGEKVLEPGDFTISIGGCSPCSKNPEIGAAKHISTVLSVK